MRVTRAEEKNGSNLILLLISKFAPPCFSAQIKEPLSLSSAIREERRERGEGERGMGREGGKEREGEGGEEREAGGTQLRANFDHGYSPFTLLLDQHLLLRLLILFSQQSTSATPFGSTCPSSDPPYHMILAQRVKKV